MGFLAKAKRVKHENPLEVGLHLVTIKVIRWARNYKGDIVVNADGVMDIEVIFQTEDGLRVTDYFPNDPKMEWALESLRKAAGVYEKGRSSAATDLLEKKVWLFVQGEVIIESGKVKRDQGGNIMYNKTILKKYEPALGSRPTVLGDPAHAEDHLPGGVFLKNNFNLRDFLHESQIMSDEF